MNARPLTVKFAEGSDDVLKILSVPFGGPIAGKDWSGEYFSPRTNLHLDVIKGPLPLLYDHGTDATLKHAVIGVADADSYAKDDMGWWVEAQLDRHGRYYVALKKLIEKQALYGSTGSPTALNRKSADGEILDWWVVEQTLTPIPCNILSVVEPAVARKHYQDAGLAFPAIALGAESLPQTMAAIARARAAADKLGALLTKAAKDTGYNVDDNEFGAGRGDFAYVDANGRGHLPLHDAAHARAALARFNQAQIPESARAGAWKKVLAACKHFGIDVSDDSMPKHVAALRVPTGTRVPVGPPLATKAGQVLSRANADRLRQAHDHLAAVGKSAGMAMCEAPQT